MSSPTIDAILRRHNSNGLLQTAGPPAVPRHEQDLSGEQPRTAVDEDVIAAARAALDDGQTHYVDVPGIPPLRQALADYLQTATGAGYDSAQVIVTAGIQEARFLTLQKIGETFDRLALPAVVHPGARQAIGARPLPVHELPVSEEMGLLPSPAAIRAALDGGVRLFYLESPARLTGRAYSSDDVAALAKMLAEAEAAVIWDQGLAPWAEPAPSLAAEAGMKARVAVIGEAWPGSGLESWFLGYIAAPAAWVAPMTKQKQIMAICTSTATQYAGLAAGERHGGQHDEQRDRLAQTRTTVARRLAAAGLAVVPGHAASVLAVRLPADQKEAAAGRLQAAGFSFADGAHFGDEAVIRLAMSFDETALTAAQQLTAA